MITHISYINKLKEFLDVLELFSYQTILVLGNHEFYGSDIHNIEAYREMIDGYKNIHLLDNETYTIDNVNIIGTTLWTPVRVASKDRVNDVNYIKNFTDDVVNVYEKNVKFINKAYNKNKKNIVLTHHAPSEKSIAPQYKFHYRDNLYFVHDIGDNIIKKMDFWIHGHTHTCFDYNIGECRVICNPSGYRHERTEWKMEIFEI